MEKHEETYAGIQSNADWKCQIIRLDFSCVNPF